MGIRRNLIVGLLTGAVAGIVVAFGYVAFAPDPSADVRRGSEEAFASGLHRRELPPGHPPQRWTTAQAEFRFARLRPGPAFLDVEAAGHRNGLTILVDGAAVGALAPGATATRVSLPSASDGRRTVVLAVPTFPASGRELGTLLRRVTLTPRERAPWPRFGLILMFAVPAALVAAAAALADAPPWGPAAAAAGTALVQGLALAPSGVAHSPYGVRAAALMIGAALFAMAFARLFGGEAKAASCAAMLVAFAVHGLFGTSPLVVASDAVFHANKLAAVAAGDLFPTSVTQHARPFRFPYGVSFYALLAPLARAGIDAVALVRGGVAVAQLMATAALFLAVRSHRGARVAAAAALVASLLPGAFDVAYSYGNYSNAFGQAATVAWFAWWATAAPGGWVVGALLFVVAALAHFSSLVVVCALAAALVALHGGRPDRTRLMALAAGVVLAAAYYARFLPLVIEQLPRMVEGGGQGRGASRGAGDALWWQVLTLVGQWGVPAMALAWVGRPRRSGGGFERDQIAWWVAGAVLAVPAVLSPLEVRYVYALMAPLAMAAGSGLVGLAEGGGPRPWLALALLALQTGLLATHLAEAVLTRYRV